MHQTTIPDLITPTSKKDDYDKVTVNHSISVQASAESGIDTSACAVSLPVVIGNVPFKEDFDKYQDTPLVLPQRVMDKYPEFFPLAGDNLAESEHLEEEIDLDEEDPDEEMESEEADEEDEGSEKSRESDDEGDDGEETEATSAGGNSNDDQSEY